MLCCVRALLRSFHQFFFSGDESFYFLAFLKWIIWDFNRRRVCGEIQSAVKQFNWVDLFVKRFLVFDVELFSEEWRKKALTGFIWGLVTYSEFSIDNARDWIIKSLIEMPRYDDDYDGNRMKYKFRHFNIWREKIFVEIKIFVFLHFFIFTLRYYAF